jgi:hypothetical protein
MTFSIAGYALTRWAPIAALLFTAASASAQDATVGVGASTTLPPRPGAPGPYTAPAYAPVAGNDHDLWVGHFGVGWYGVRGVPAGSAATDPVATPVVGVRYWLSPTLGIDGALGLGITSGSTTNNGATSDKNSRTAVLLHGGVPIVLGGSRHFSFQVIPELEVGFSTGKNGGAADVSGFLLQLGARAGAEVYFGFIGIPALALEGSVGLFLTSVSGKTTQPNGMSVSDSNFFLGTRVLNDPWDIFRSNVAARYYF